MAPVSIRPLARAEQAQTKRRPFDAARRKNVALNCRD
jgi:hypothetical protein